jgi:hypothetical protein
MSSDSISDKKDPLSGWRGIIFRCNFAKTPPRIVSSYLGSIFYFSSIPLHYYFLLLFICLFSFSRYGVDRRPASSGQALTRLAPDSCELWRPSARSRSEDRAPSAPPAPPPRTRPPRRPYQASPPGWSSRALPHRPVRKAAASREPPSWGRRGASRRAPTSWVR